MRGVETRAAPRGIAIIDDYHGVALRMADWSVLPAGCRVEVFRDHLADREALVTALIKESSS